MDSISKARAGLKAMAELRDAGGKYFRANPSASRFLDRLMKRDPSYVAHEFCNACFEPQYFMDVAGEMQALGLTYAGTAKIHRNNSANILHAKHTKHLDQARDPLDRQSRISFLRNESFRRDVCIRDRSPLPPNKQEGLFDDIIVGANVADHQLETSLDLGFRKFDLETSFFPILKMLAATGRYSFAELRDHPDLAPYDKSEITTAIHDLIGGYQFQPLARRAMDVAIKPANSYRLTSDINRFFLEYRLLKDRKVYLQSPFLGSAIRMRLVYGLIVRALDGRGLPQARALLLDQMSSLSPELMAGLGRPKDAQTEAWLDKNLRSFERVHLPVLLKYGILETG